MNKDGDIGSYETEELAGHTSLEYKLLASGRVENETKVTIWDHCERPVNQIETMAQLQKLSRG
jgi:hypothetical protein